MLNEEERKVLKKYAKHRTIGKLMSEVYQNFGDIEESLTKVIKLSDEIGREEFRKSIESFHDDVLVNRIENIRQTNEEYRNLDIFYHTKNIIQERWSVKGYEKENEKILFSNGKVEVPIDVDDWEYITDQIDKGYFNSDDTWDDFLLYLIDEELDMEVKK